MKQEKSDSASEFKTQNPGNLGDLNVKGGASVVGLHTSDFLIPFLIEEELFSLLET